jgi:predicted dehydrogenase
VSALQQLGVGIIGCGAMGRIHAGNLRTLGGARVVAASDPFESARNHLAAACDVPPACYGDYQALLDRSDVDAVIITVPNALHRAVSTAAIAAGKHVLLEKPLAHNVEDGMAIVRAAEQSDRVVMLGFNNRFRTPARYLRQAITGGRLGSVYYARARWLRRDGLPPRSSWFTTRAGAGGGPLIDIGVHVLDLALHMMGYPQALTAFGVAYAYFGPERARTVLPLAEGSAAAADVYDVEDFASGMITLANGATILVETSWATFIQDDDLSLDILGSAGGARMTDDDERGLSIYTTMDGEHTDITVRLDESDSHLEELRAFLAAIHDGGTAPVLVRDGLRVLAIIEALYASALSGEAVPVRHTP